MHRLKALIAPWVKWPLGVFGDSHQYWLILTRHESSIGCLLVTLVDN